MFAYSNLATCYCWGNLSFILYFFLFIFFHLLLSMWNTLIEWISIENPLISVVRRISQILRKKIQWISLGLYKFPIHGYSLFLYYYLHKIKLLQLFSLIRVSLDKWNDYWKRYKIIYLNLIFLLKTNFKSNFSLKKLKVPWKFFKNLFYSRVK